LKLNFEFDPTQAISFKIEGLPPSTNRIWRSGRKHGKVFVYRSKEYLDWIKDVDYQWLVQRGQQPKKFISGKFIAYIGITPPDARRRDLDNSAKALLDFCVRARIVDDDHLAQFIISEMKTPNASAPGCELKIIAYKP
jgi:Holliday junction resolvase RusA-like endonuclease